MSYSSSAALQRGLFEALRGDPAVSALVGEAIYDTVPGGPLPDLYLTLGVETAQATADAGGVLTRHRLGVGIVSEAAGFASAKALAAAVSAVLDGAALDLAPDRLLSLRFERAEARRVDRNRKRRIDLRFLALVDGQ